MNDDEKLNSIRERIDQLDLEIQRLLNARAQAAQEVARIKLVFMLLVALTIAVAMKIVGVLLITALLLLVPLESFFQLRPRAEERGTVIAAANFAGFSGMMVAGLGDMALCRVLSSPQRFGLLGLLALGAAGARLGKARGARGAGPRRQRGVVGQQGAVKGGAP